MEKILQGKKQGFLDKTSFSDIVLGRQGGAYSGNCQQKRYSVLDGSPSRIQRR